jgi:hypothetical protein
LCDPQDAEAVCSLLACSDRWARDLTQPAREAALLERDARIVAAREAEEPVRQIAAREGVGVATVLRVPKRKAAKAERLAAAQAPKPAPEPEPPLPVLKPA